MEQQITVGWRKLHNEKFHNLYYSPNIIKVTKKKGEGSTTSG
jgi:hypothetical protein